MKATAQLAAFSLPSAPGTGCAQKRGERDGADWLGTAPAGSARGGGHDPDHQRAGASAAAAPSGRAPFLVISLAVRSSQRAVTAPPRTP